MTAHLSETAASTLALSDQDRIQHIRKPRWIGYGRAKEILGPTLATIHNVHFMVNLVDRMRTAIEEGYFPEYKAEFLARYKNSD